MIRFSINEEKLNRIFPYHREFQGAIEVLANKKMGIEIAQLNGIAKTEGGVTVNNREIAIKSNYVVDDFKKSYNEETPEERATVDAIIDALAYFDNKGVDALNGIIAGRMPFVPFIDHLRALFGERFYNKSPVA